MIILQAGVSLLPRPDRSWHTDTMCSHEFANQESTLRGTSHQKVVEQDAVVAAVLLPDAPRRVCVVARRLRGACTMQEMCKIPDSSDSGASGVPAQCHHQFD